ncbi:PREDICTED: uncharacterized protein LOC105565491 [Vollenhovia emeryi]|uniref:uncharacterized protein LOC105565491 n=1 Tax=Vollenhovia emeryi TaxID=411798 RepID=UPI0005F412FE|nr:PREDICTED: uncharacterized protein LOC105565491 [Vollenhovia emeryi]
MQTLPWTNGVKDKIGFPISPKQNGIKSESRWTISHCKVIESSTRFTPVSTVIVIQSRRPILNERTIRKNIAKRDNTENLYFAHTPVGIHIFHTTHSSETPRNATWLKLG